MIMRWFKLRLTAKARQASRIMCFVVLFTGAPSAYAEKAPLIEQLTFDTNPSPTVKPAKIKATLYLPPRRAPVPAMVIMSSSGGVLERIEGYYARELGRAGIASLVVDSFRPRGVKRVVEDQSLVSSWDMENDAFAALAILRKDVRIDASHIGIMGVSKGGIVAQHAAFKVRQRWRGTGDLAFAVHVPIVPDCAAQHRDVTTTGRPLLYMLAELDDYNSPQFCKDYADRIRTAGNANVKVIMYKGAHHGFEISGPVFYEAKAENYATCRAFYEDDGAMTMAVPGGPTLMKGSDIFAWRRAHCMRIGAHVGGGTDKLKHEALNDLLQFLRAQGF